MNDEKTTSSTSLQMVSDLLYHSARINLNKTTNNDLSGGINFSRYKTSSDELILGAFDLYSLGDVSSYASGSLIGAQSGVGLSMQRAPTFYRQGNTQINIEEQAPPGWEAELFLNNRFIGTTTVSETGLLVFNDVDIYYGTNEFLIKIYGPYGEVVEYNKSYPLISNPLAEGNMAYGLYALDNERSLLNGNNPDRGFELNSLGGSFAYGVTDRWQVGVAFQDFTRQFDQQHQQLVALSNYLSFPGLLLENEITFNADAEYVQKTTASGNLFGQGAYQMSLESGDGLGLYSTNSNNIGKYQQASAAYFDYFYDIPVRFQATYNHNQNITSQTLSNSIFYNYKRLRFFHSAIYSRVSQDFNGEKLIVNNVNGSFGVSGSLFNNLRLSADIKYDPQKDDPILKSSRLTAQYKWEDPFLLNHYFTFNYQPLAEPDNEWQLNYNLAYETTDYRLSLNSNYKANNEWSFGLNLNFFFGYDYYNNRPLTSSSFSAQSATLDIHTYLDRQLNGESDVLDYDLEGVEFYGNNDWQGLTTGKSGKILLPGASVNSPFSFGGTWKNGTQTFNTDYVVYTHPGARIDVNMPFYLSTEVASFVYRETENGEIPVSQLKIELVDNDGVVVQTTASDEDGYFEFTNMKPSQYTVSINRQSLHDKALTADTLGYKFNTPRVGGFTELPTIYVTQQQSADELSDEALAPMVLNEDNIELLVWDTDKQKRQNYFSLPSKQRVAAPHTRDSNSSADDDDNTAVYSTDNVIDDTKKQSATSESLSQSNTTNSNKIEGPKKSATKTSLSQFYTLQLGAFANLSSANEFVQNHRSGLGSQFSIVENRAKKWQTMYKVYFGKFALKPEAENFALTQNLQNNEYWIQQITEAELLELSKVAVETDGEIILTLETDDSPSNLVVPTAPIEGWVIQFYASQSPILPAEAKQFSAAGPIYMATKLLPNSDTIWYCLISRGFASKELALQSMQNANLKGWINSGAIYSNAVVIAQ